MSSFWIWTALLIPSLFVFGFKAILIWLCGIVLCLIGFLLTQMVLAVMGQWNKFKQEREREAQQIIARLGGVPTSVPLSTGTEGIIASIRARAGKSRP
jgi:hypothetical protein